MNRRFVTASRLLATLVLTCAGATAGCSKSTAQASSSALPALDPKTAKEETWTLEDLGKTDFLVFAQAKVTLSKTCLKGSALECAALRTLKAGAVVEVKKAKLDARMSAGARVCQALSHELVNGRGPGGEDAFCKFEDGSLVSAGALETYALKIVP
jgi:hypothetical protein